MVARNSETMDYASSPPLKARLRKVKRDIDYLRYLYWKLRLRLNKATLKKPIFFIGVPRSGTTLAVNLFATHELVANWSEAGHIWDPDYYNPNTDHYWPKELVTDEARVRLHSIFEHYRQIKQKPRFVNKHPRNSVRVEYINEIFPDAFFIHVVRDGRAVANSVLNKIKKSSFRQRYPFGFFCKPPHWRAYVKRDFVEQSAYLWTGILEYIEAVKGILGRRYVEIKYEELTEKPREVYRYLFEIVGLPCSKEYLSHIPEHLKNMNYKYKRDLAPKDLKRIETIQEATLKKYGYLV